MHNRRAVVAGVMGAALMGTAQAALAQDALVANHWKVLLDVPEDNEFAPFTAGWFAFEDRGGVAVCDFRDWIPADPGEEIGGVTPRSVPAPGALALAAAGAGAIARRPRR